MKKNNRVAKLVFIFAMFLLTFVFINIFLSSFMLIFKVSINEYYICISAIITLIIILFVMNKNGLLIKNNKKIDIVSIFVSIILPIITIFSSFFFCDNYYEYTYDGNSYHKSTVGYLANGWNPVYQKMEEFDRNSKFPLYVKENSYLWGNHYAKASHMFSANVYAFTNNIESGKSINLICIIMLFSFLLAILIYKKQNLFFSILFSLSVVSLPTISTQFLTNYVDILVYIFFFLTVCIWYMIVSKDNIINENSVLFCYFMILVISINIKFSLFGYVGIYSLMYYIYLIIRSKNAEQRKFLKKLTIISFISVIIGVFVVGLSVYPKNMLEHGHPFYPIRGNNKVEIMTQNQPDYFKNKSNIEKFVIATFSEAKNISASSKEEAKYKIPFQIKKGEIDETYAADLRISGNGVLFSGILSLVLIVLIIYFFKNGFKKDIFSQFCFLSMLFSIFMIITISESWWARYFPQLLLIIFLPIIIIYNSKYNYFKVLAYILIILILVNNSISCVESFQYVDDYRKEVDNWYNYFDQTADEDKCCINIYTKDFQGSLFNVLDKYDDYCVNIIDSDNYNYVPGTFFSIYGPYAVWNCNLGGRE